jgi:hypothetical protein
MPSSTVHTIDYKHFKVKAKLREPLGISLLFGCPFRRSEAAFDMGKKV